MAQHEASVILLCTKTWRLWGLASILRSFFFHVMGTTCCRASFLLTCVPCWASHFLVGMAFCGSTGAVQRPQQSGFAWGGRSMEAKYDTLRNRMSDRSDRFGSFPNLWCLTKEFTGFGGAGTRVL